MAKSKWFDKKWLVVLVYTNIQMYRYTCSGADPGFLLGAGALVSCSTSHPLHPPPGSAPDAYKIQCVVTVYFLIIL